MLRPDAAAERRAASLPARRPWRPRVAAAVVAAVAAAASPTSGAVDGQPVRAADGIAYRLVDTWSDRPWSPAAGRYGHIADVSSGPDGTVYVLDNRTVGGRAAMLHVLRPDGTPLRWLPLPDEPDVAEPPVPYRLDVGADGRLYVLSMSQRDLNGRIVYLVDRLRPDATLESRLRLPLQPPRGYADIAVSDGGRVYLSRLGATQWCYEPGAPPPRNLPGEVPSYAIDILEPSGQVTVLTPAELAVPLSLDVDADGTVIVVNHVIPRCSPGGGPGDPGDPPVPSGAPGWPWWARAMAAAATPAAGQAATGQAVALQAPEPIAGLLVLGADDAVDGTIPWSSAEDVAVGPAGRFVSRNSEIYALRPGAEAGGLGAVEELPLYAGPTDRVYAQLFLGHRVLSLDVPRRGGVLMAAMNHCSFQGTLRFDTPTARPAEPALVGALDSPELEGPAFPIRIAAAETLRVLLGRMNILGTRPHQSYHSIEIDAENQTAQRWTTDGRLSDQIGLCSGSESWLVRDVAADGDDSYAVDPSFLQRRPDARLPAWSYWGGDLDAADAEPFFTAVGADAGRAAVLDVGRGRVHVVGRDGAAHAVWPAAPDGATVPVDIALRGTRVYLADAARGRITVRDLAGAEVGAFDTHDGASAVAVDRAGDVYVLGRGGWAYRYRPDGVLVAAWPMPVRDRIPLDIAVDDGGRVFVNFIRLGVQGDGRWGQGVRVHEGGVWVFAPAAAPASPPPPADACLGVPDKFASPRRIPLGDTVQVTLTVVGRCPGRGHPADIMLVFDTSRSMGYESGLDRAKETALAILGTLDASSVRVGLATFDDAPTLVAPLSGDIARVRTAVAGLRAGGDTQLAGALAAVRLQLGDAPVPGRQRLALLFTDGVVKDRDTLALVQAGEELRAAEIALHAFVFPSWELQTEHLEVLARLVQYPGTLLHVDPDAREVQKVAADLVGYRPEAVAFRDLTVVDRIPANMRYVERSASPSATYDAAAHALTWRGIRNQPAGETLRLRYLLEPLEVGTWPTNIDARAPYTDALGAAGELVFPIPAVEVYRPLRKLYLPLALRAGCVARARPVDVALVIDASSSMDEPRAAGPGTKLDAARDAAEAFVRRIDPAADRAAIIAFNSAGRRLVPLTGEIDRLVLGLAAIESAEGTRIDLGLAEAAAALEGRRPGALAAVIVLTDGLQTNPPGNDAVISEADRLKAAGAVVYTIGLGATTDAALLGAVASSPDRSFTSPSDAELAAIYDAILARLACDQAAATTP